jgi:hypothetical protein
MRKTVRQPINSAWRQANSKITASDMWIIQYARDFIQASLRNFGIGMHEPKHLAMRGACTGIHLDCAAQRTFNELVAKACSEIGRAVATSPISDDNLRSRRSLTQMLKEWAYKWRLIKDRNNDGELRSSAFH